MFDFLFEFIDNSPLKPVVENLKSLTYFLFKKSKSVTWIFGITLIIVVFPLILEVEREQQMIEMQKQQGYGPPGGIAPY